jgi:hypothetical protein
VRSGAGNAEGGGRPDLPGSMLVRATAVYKS